MACKNNSLITAAIDFGTTFSGYAYGFKCDLEKDPPTIITNRWPAGESISQKAPTTVLFNPDQSFNSFGYEAEEKYAELCENGKHNESPEVETVLTAENSSVHYGWDGSDGNSKDVAVTLGRPMASSQRPIKHNTKSIGSLSKTTTLEDEGKKRMPAIKVFAAAICFLKEHLLESVCDKVSEITGDDVFWLLSVPAIWKDAAKQFMREAAKMAGISHDQLMIALEPECASVYCQRIPTEKKKLPDGAKLRIAEPYSRFLVLDLGGGTADITVHERKPDCTLKELHKASGGAWGGTKVDREFINLLIHIFECANVTNVEENILNQFKSRHMEDYVDLLREFEVKKRKARLDGDEQTTIRLPVSLKEIFEEEAKTTLKDIVGKTKFSDKITLAADKMKLKSSVVKTLFTPAVDSIINHLKQLFKLPEVSKIDTILMVGGFSASILVQEAIRKNFQSKKVYIPGEPDLAVLVGAVLFGNDPQVISSRKCRFTYGITTSLPFEPGKHPEDKKRVYDGKDYCGDCFAKLVDVDQILEVGVPTNASTHHPLQRDQTAMTLGIYAAVEKSPKYVTDSCCQYLGCINVDMPDIEGGKSRQVQVKVNFAGTELEVEALEKTTNKIYKIRVDFLG